MAMQTLFSSDDWSVVEAPIIGWGYNAKGTFYLHIERTSAKGAKFPWTMNVPESKLGALPSLLDNLPKEQVPNLRFTGGWVCGDASVEVGLAQ